MHQFSKLQDLFHSINLHLVAEFEKFPVEKREAINSNVVAEWLGEKSDQSILGDVSVFGDFAWRTTYLMTAVSELRQVSSWANSIPIRKLNISTCEQIEFVWWLHFTKLGEFQDRLFKFYDSATKLVQGDVERSEIVLTKRQFTKTFMSALKGKIETRNFWVHDFKPDIAELKRLSSLELFAKLYKSGSDSSDLSKLLLKECRRVEKAERERLKSILSQDQIMVEKLADNVVVFVDKYIDFNFLNIVPLSKS